MKAVVVRAQNEVGFDDVAAPGPCGETDVRVRINTVGICGSDIHYVTHGRIGSYVVRAPMVLGHEASGVVTEVGTAVRHLSVGDRVCMDPGIPNPQSRAARLGIYNVDPDMVFWATPPVDGCLLSEVVHPAAFTYRMPDHSSPGRTTTYGESSSAKRVAGCPE
jgi:D-xylulose reductase